MAELSDLRRAYLIGILDGFRLARAETLPEAEDLIAEVESNMESKMRDVRAAFDRICARDGVDETDERDRPPRLN